MKKEKLARSVIKTTLSTAIKAIEKDPKRATRDLVEKGCAFSNSRFQAGFFNLISSMLLNDDSEYYKLTENLSKDLDKEYIYQFGMNIGYNTCVVGAKKIRKLKIEEKIDVPWLIALKYASKQKLNIINLTNMIEEAIEVGIYFYPIITSSEDVHDLLPIFEKYKECSFAIILNDNNIDDDFISKTGKLKNIALVLDCQKQNFYETAYNLKIRKILHASYMHYDNETVFDESIFEQVKEATNTFFILLPKIDTSSQKMKEAGYFAKSCRFKQNLPFIVVDSISDAEFYNNILTGNTRMLAFDSQGSMMLKKNNNIKKDINILSNKLINILKYSSNVDNL